MCLELIGAGFYRLGSLDGMVVSQNTVTQYRHHNAIIILRMGTPKKVHLFLKNTQTSFRGQGFPKVCRLLGLGHQFRVCRVCRVWFGSIPHPVMGTTRDYCRYIKALITPS